VPPGQKIQANWRGFLLDFPLARCNFSRVIEIEINLNNKLKSMKIRSLSVQISAGVGLALLACDISNGHAASATLIQNAGDTFAQASPFQNVAWEEAKVEKLRHAYHLLEQADGDYSGHRVAAMRSIKKAAEILGVEIKGNGHAEESQWKSDRKVQEAKNLLADLADETTGKEQAHVHLAMKELDKALAIK